jgi:hypothetical protein
MRQAGARHSQARVVSWERLAPAWRVTEMAKLQAVGFTHAMCVTGRVALGGCVKNLVVVFFFP